MSWLRAAAPPLELPQDFRSPLNLPPPAPPAAVFDLWDSALTAGKACLPGKLHARTHEGAAPGGGHPPKGPSGTMQRADSYGLGHVRFANGYGGANGASV